MDVKFKIWVWSVGERAGRRGGRTARTDYNVSGGVVVVRCSWSWSCSPVSPQPGGHWLSTGLERSLNLILPTLVSKRPPPAGAALPNQTQIQQICNERNFQAALNGFIAQRLEICFSYWSLFMRTHLGTENLEYKLCIITHNGKALIPLCQICTVEIFPNEKSDTSLMIQIWLLRCWITSIQQTCRPSMRRWLCRRTK